VNETRARKERNRVHVDLTMVGNWECEDKSAYFEHISPYTTTKLIKLAILK
jgi:hypothetical protein